jgi:hypothetical protein
MRWDKPKHGKLGNSEIFLEHITTLLKNLLIKNVNYENSYYANQYGKPFELIKDTQERASYILGEIEETKHLIEEEDDR